MGRVALSAWALVRAALCVFAIIWAEPASAQFFSPGELTSSHQSLEGDTHCNDCHSAGRGVHYASFEPESPLYNKGYDEKFAFAKRVLPRGLPPAAAQPTAPATAAAATTPAP